MKCTHSFSRIALVIAMACACWVLTFPRTAQATCTLVTTQGNNAAYGNCAGVTPAPLLSGRPS